MINEQTIAFVGFLNFNINSGGIIEKDTEILNLIFSDNGNSNMLVLIGNRLEWKPKIWIEFERERLEKLKELNIVCLMGDLTEFFSYCQQTFPNVKINYYDYSAYDISTITIRSSLTRKKLVTKRERKNIVYSSIGTMRLNRYILVKEALAKGYNFYYPEISYNLSRDYEYQIAQCLSQEMHTPKKYAASRLFGDQIDQEEFNKRQIETLCESYVHIVVTFPNTDWLKDKDDEKYFDTILCKTVPFMLCEKDSNTSGLELLGFLPYKGFDLKNDSNDNPVLRWKSILEDNEHIFKDMEKVKDLYEMNRPVIEYNYNRLISTDWEAKRLAQYNKLPTSIKKYLENF